ncbi:MAG TPA: DUF4173 domain-containing protein [Patescibacteria group bacterium]|nr:DUF4173 domain-containing protein [Patescibacteria group bacterium]
MSEPSSTSTLTVAVLKRALLVVAASLGFGLVFDILFFEKAPGISFPIYILLTFGGILSAARLFKTKIPASAYWVAAPLLLFSSMLFVRAGGLVTFFNFMASLYLLALMLYLIFKPKLYTFSPQQYIAPLYEMPLQLLSRLQATITDLGILRGVATKHKAVPQIVRGVLIALPVLVLFVALFSSADLVFRKYITDVFNVHFNGQFVAHGFWIIAATAVFVGVFGYLQKGPAALSSLASKNGQAVEKPRRQGFGLTEASILFGSLNVLFLAFILVQLAYLFGGEHNITVQGFTYAEYARKGFFELLAVAVISFLLILGAEKALTIKDQKHSVRFKFLSAALILQVMVVMVSAFKRMALYESAYGFTSLRLYVQIAIVWLAVVFCILLYKIFKDQRDSTFAFLSFTSLILLLAFINIINVDAFVAHKNISRYYATGKLDVGYLSSLSDDGVTTIITLADSKDTNLRQDIAGSLYQKRLSLQTKDRYWQSANLSRKAALKALDSKAAWIEQNKYKGLQDFVAPAED